MSRRTLYTRNYDYWRYYNFAYVERGATNIGIVKTGQKWGANLIKYPGDGKFCIKGGDEVRHDLLRKMARVVATMPEVNKSHFWQRMRGFFAGDHHYKYFSKNNWPVEWFDEEALQKYVYKNITSPNLYIPDSFVNIIDLATASKIFQYCKKEISQQIIAKFGSKIITDSASAMHFVTCMNFADVPDPAEAVEKICEFSPGIFDIVKYLAAKNKK